MALLGNAASGNQILAQDLLAQVVAQSYLMSGATPSTSATLTLTYGAQEAVVNNGTLAQYVKLAAGTLTVAASKDTYIDLGYSGMYSGGVANGTLAQVAVANGAAAPTVSANSVRLWKVTSNATAITAVTLLAATQPLTLAQIVVPSVRAYQTGGQNIANATYTPITLDSTRWDQGTPNGAPQHSTSANTSRLTCQQAGIYAIIGNLAYQASATGVSRQCIIRLNGVTSLAMANAPVGNLPYAVVSTQWPLSVGDYVELVAYQDSGGLLGTADNPDEAPEFMMTRLG